jgi:hypothetical protein
MLTTEHLMTQTFEVKPKSKYFMPALQKMQENFEAYKRVTTRQILELQTAVIQQHETIAFLLDAIQQLNSYEDDKV